jgi:hypothetical protein
VNGEEPDALKQSIATWYSLFNSDANLHSLQIISKDVYHAIASACNRANRVTSIFWLMPRRTQLHAAESGLNCLVMLIKRFHTEFNKRAP